MDYGQIYTRATRQIFLYYVSSISLRSRHEVDTNYIMYYVYIINIYYIYTSLTNDLYNNFSFTFVSRL